MGSNPAAEKGGKNDSMSSLIGKSFQAKTNLAQPTSGETLQINTNPICWPIRMRANSTTAFRNAICRVSLGHQVLDGLYPWFRMFLEFVWVLSLINSMRCTLGLMRRGRPHASFAAVLEACFRNPMTSNDQAMISPSPAPIWVSLRISSCHGSPPVAPA